MRRVIITTIILAIGIALGATVSWADINNGLVAYWPFNNNLNDVTGNGHDGEMINGTVSYIQGVRGKGIKLPGTTDARISLSPWVPVNSSLTISGWVKVLDQDELWNGYQGPIFVSQHGDFSHGFYIRPAMRDQELHAEFGIGASTGTGNRIHYILEPIEFYGRWHHMAGVVDRENHEIRLYYDGELVATSPLTVGAIYPTKGFIGSYDYIVARNGNTRFVSPSHRLDEIRLYNRALANEEIQNLFLEANSTPIAYAGEDISINSEEIVDTVVQGKATDEDADDILQYRWKEGETVFMDWSPVNESGDCPLFLGPISIGVGTHTLTIEITDGIDTSTDDMILVINNSPPKVTPQGGGVYEINKEITFGGYVSDFDGDLLDYKWMEGTDVLFIGTIQAIAGGTLVKLPDHSISTLSLGMHTIILKVDDGVNEPVIAETAVNIVDQTPPILAPVANKYSLWPPNHKMVDITIEANATDNSALPVILSVLISSNEPIEGSGKGDKSPDWTEPLINQENGVITFQLRAERLGKGSGRIYTVAITATDTCNNIHTENIGIIVPHNKKKK